MYIYNIYMCTCAPTVEDGGGAGVCLCVLALVYVLCVCACMCAWGKQTTKKKGK